MDEYHKINTMFKRDMANGGRLLLGQWSTPEFEYLSENRWVFTEKVDGMNIRVQWRGGSVTYGGKTDAASIPAPLVARLIERFGGTNGAARLGTVFDCDACLYGEGYGAKIQKGGGNYRPDQDFVLFDVRVGGWWLKREDVEDVAKKLGLDVVPEVGRGRLSDGIRLVQDGFTSRWGPFVAEGIVARPTVELKDRNGNRIITKIKYVDFAENAKKGGG